MRSQIGEIQFGSTSLVFSIRRSDKRGTVAVTVNPDTTVSVVAPKGMRKTHIQEMVLKKADWILRQQESFRQQHNGHAKRFVSGESFFYLGRQHKLKVVISNETTERVQVRLLHGKMLVTVSKSINYDNRADKIYRAILKWYRTRAQERIPQLTERYATSLGINVTAVQVRNMRRRWGSAQGDGKLGFNWRIIMAPTRLIEYVVAHEICHLKHNDHSREFWKMLERVMPDYERRRSELAVHGPKYDLVLVDMKK